MFHFSVLSAVYNFEVYTGFYCVLNDCNLPRESALGEENWVINPKVKGVYMLYLLRQGMNLCVSPRLIKSIKQMSHDSTPTPQFMYIVR